MGCTTLLLLWDIDGTLLKGKGAGRRAMDDAFLEVFGVADAFAGMHMAGGLDLHFVHTLFARRNIDLSRAPEFLEAYYQALPKRLTDCGAELAPHVVETLEALEARPGIFQALGTGNLERGARLKLEPFGLNRFFPVGGFCVTLTERYKVLEQGVANASRYYQKEFAAGDVVVIGDTVRDIEAARQIGAKVVAVSTGGNTPEELAQLKPDALIPNLNGFLQVLDSLSQTKE